MNTVPLGAVVECLDRMRVPVTEAERAPGDVPYFGANGQQGWIDRAIFNEPLVIVAEDGGHFANPSRGVAYRIDGPAWVNNHGHVLRATAQVDTDYLFRVLQNYNFQPYISGSTRSKLTQKQLLSAEIPLPPLREQRRVATVLEQADALRAKRRQVLAYIDSLSQSVFHDMFSGGRWPVASLDEVSVVAGEYGASVPSIEPLEDRPRYVRITDISDSGTLNDDVRSPGGQPSDWLRYELVDGDLLFARSGATVGKTFRYRNSDGPCVFAGYLIRYRPDSEVVNPDYLFAFTKSRQYATWVALRQNVVAQPNINARQYGRELPVPIPPIGLQREFANRVEEIRAQRSAVQRALNADDELFASLHSRAFRGEL